MYLNYKDDNKYLNKMEELYLNLFLNDERLHFWILKGCSKENNLDLYDIINNNKFIEMCYIVNLNDKK